jgi:adenylate kinase family enzyme
MCEENIDRMDSKEQMAVVNRLAVYVLGRTGSGKTSMAMLLEAALDFHHVSGSGLLRRLAAMEQGQLSCDAKKALDTGGMVPDGVMLSMYETELSVSDRVRKCLDGNPRNMAYFDKLRSLLARHGYEDATLMFLYLKIDRGVVEHRLSLRRVCSLCGTQTALFECPKCQGETAERLDDANPAVVAERNRWFEEDVAPVLEWLDAKGWLVTIEADQTLSKVSEQALAAVSARLDALSRLG